jgi:hypothetical protein
MSTKKIAIACQGGGGHCALVGGALETLIAPDVQNRCHDAGRIRPGRPA